MSYYLLPKNINNINVNPIFSKKQCNLYTSFSLYNYYTLNTNDIKELLNSYFEEAIRIVNPCEFIFSNVPGSNFSVSKLNPKTNIFYDLFEIFNNINIFDIFINKNIRTLHFSPNYYDSVECNELIRENKNDINVYYNDIFSFNNLNDIKYEHIFYECKKEDYFVSLIIVLIIIIKNQETNGNCIIKINDMFHKPVIDFLYLLTSLYEKVYIFKPSTTNITSFEKYIVCKNFRYNYTNNSYLKFNYYKLIIFLKKLENSYITDILDFEVPYLFKSKINELNIIIGQQQLDAFDQIISIFKNKNKEDKIDNLIKCNIQKSVSWCEKYKIPYNKFNEKVNIFLPITNENEKQQVI